MIVDNNYKKFNINKLNRTGGYESNSTGTVYLGSGNKITENISAIQPHYLWGNLFNGTQDIDGDIDFKGNINFVGDDDGYHGNINAISAVLKNLTVTGSAYFAELVIDKIKAAGGAIILSPADGFEIIKIETVTNGIKLYFLAEANDKKIMNMWAVDDQLIIKDFNNASLGTSLNVSNRYFWGIVTGIDSTPVDIVIEGGQTVSAHYVIVSDSDYDGTLPDNYYIGANCVQLGNRTDTTRQGAIYMTAYNNTLDTGLTAPYIAIYDGINSYNLGSSNRKTWLSMNGNQLSGTLMVYDTNADNRVKISPSTVGILEDWIFENFNQTVIGIDGMFSGNSDKYFWNGQDEISMKYAGTNTDYRMKINDEGITRTQVKNGQIHGIPLGGGDYRYPMTDISTTMPVVTIQYNNNGGPGNPIIIDNNAGFVICTMTSGTNEVRLPHTYDCMGKIIYIKSYSPNCIVYSQSGEEIVYAGDPPNGDTNREIGDDFTAFISDGGTYWHEFKGI